MGLSPSLWSPSKCLINFFHTANPKERNSHQIRNTIEKNPIHLGLFELEKQGLVKQWKRNPQYFFVNGLDKVALATFNDKIGLANRFTAKTQAELERVKELAALANELVA